MAGNAPFAGPAGQPAFGYRRERLGRTWSPLFNQVIRNYVNLEIQAVLGTGQKVLLLLQISDGQWIRCQPGRVELQSDRGFLDAQLGAIMIKRTATSIE